MIGCPTGAVVKGSPLTAAIQVWYPVLHVMVMWSPSWAADSAYSLFLPHQDYTNVIIGANKHDQYK